MTDRGIPEEAVEAAAKAAFSLADDLETWDKIPERRRKRYREEVAPVLAAATPHIVDARQYTIQAVHALADYWANGGPGRITADSRYFAEELREMLAK